MEGFHKDQKTALFTDGANFYHSVRALGLEVDFRKFRNFFAQQTNLVRAYYYTALPDDSTYTPIRPLIDFLEYNGFALIKKPVREFVDPDGRRHFKGNMDIDIAVDVMQIAPHLDHVVLASGDGDFCRLVDAVQRMGKFVTVVSTTHTKPQMLSDELRRQTDFYIDLFDLKSKISRDPQQQHNAGPDMPDHYFEGIEDHERR